MLKYVKSEKSKTTVDKLMVFCATELAKLQLKETLEKAIDDSVKNLERKSTAASSTPSKRDFVGKTRRPSNKATLKTSMRKFVSIFYY